MASFHSISDPVIIAKFLNLTILSQTVEYDTKGFSDTTETDTKEASHNPEGEEESVPMEEAKKREARDGGELIPASPAVSPGPGPTQED